MMQFKKANLESVKGRQPSKADALLPHFENQGDTLFFEEADLSRQSAAQYAARLRKISGKPFHSFYDVLEKKVAIRLRIDGEVVKKDEEEEPNEEQAEG